MQKGQILESKFQKEQKTNWRFQTVCVPETITSLRRIKMLVCKINPLVGIPY
jgi:hypothetical protein